VIRVLVVDDEALVRDGLRAIAVVSMRDGALADDLALGRSTASTAEILAAGRE
jgi:hypothetical protein